ncbi:MAG TPA: hypothetical protein VGS07_29845 [Thermoanaerobaculia bacterium]|nr:hypothetical protein [Thermoanaerobaculia bacterium]
MLIQREVRRRHDRIDLFRAPARVRPKSLPRKPPWTNRKANGNRPEEAVTTGSSPSTGNVNSRSPRGGGQVGGADAMMVVMSEPAQPITLTIPLHVVAELPQLSAELNERMHELLERNTDGALSTIERRELDTLVRMAGFGQILKLMATRQSAA